MSISTAIAAALWRGLRRIVQFIGRWVIGELVRNGARALAAYMRVRTGWLHEGADCTLPGWSTRGSFGLLAAYQLRWLGLDRAPWVLDVPIVSAVASARRYRALCPSERWRWCP
jgi:hypothetical protein